MTNGSERFRGVSGDLPAQDIAPPAPTGQSVRPPGVGEVVRRGLSPEDERKISLYYGPEVAASFDIRAVVQPPPEHEPPSQNRRI